MELTNNSIKQEIAVMKRLKHPNIVALHEVINDPTARKIFLIQEVCKSRIMLHVEGRLFDLDYTINIFPRSCVSSLDQFMEGGPLMPDNYKVKPIEISLALKFFRDILKGVCYLHR